MLGPGWPAAAGVEGACMEERRAQGWLAEYEGAVGEQAGTGGGCELKTRIREPSASGHWLKPGR